MKKLFAIFSAFIIICVIISATFDNLQRTLKESSKKQEKPKAESVYLIKSENDKIVVYYGDSLYLKTDTSIHTLPKKDRGMFINGISLDSKQEVDKVLLEYCS